MAKHKLLALIIFIGCYCALTIPTPTNAAAYGDDNDLMLSSAYVYVQTTLTTVFEGDSILIWIGRDHAYEMNGEVSVDFTTVEGTAVATDDFVPITGTVTFASGETDASILIRTRHNWLIEPEEIFYVVLTDATNAAVNASNTATIKIIDNDGSGYELYFPLVTQ